MAAVLAGLAAREVALEVREEGARDVAFAVLALAQLGLGEVVAAVENAPARKVLF
jgi:hypothetical protein